MSLRNKFIGLVGACTLLAALGCAAPIAEGAICNPCNLASLKVQGTQGTQSVTAISGGSDQVDWRYFPLIGSPSEPLVTFSAHDLYPVGVQVRASDSLSCVGPGGDYYYHYATWSSSGALGYASVTYAPYLHCPTGYEVWSSDQDAKAVDSDGQVTAVAAFNWGVLGN